MAAVLPPQKKPLAQGRNRRIAELDGLRGIAILMVLALHFHIGWEALLKATHPWIGPVLTKTMGMGLNGVRLFFVLSGFLITGVLLDTKGRPGYLRKFYGRRALRIFPLYYGVLFVVFFAIPQFCDLDAAARGVSDRQWRLWFYLANLPGGGWDESEVYKLGHFWFLSVQLHFYLIWPLVVMSCRPRRLLWVCAGLLVMSLGARTASAVLAGNAPWVLDWSTITMIDGIALGSMVAVAHRTSNDRGAALGSAARRAVIPLGAAFLVLGFVPRSFHRAIADVFREPLVAAFFACFLVLALQQGEDTVLRRSLRNRGLGFFAKYSYGVYVIHNILRPTFLRTMRPKDLTSFTRDPLPSLALYSVLCLGASVALAFAVWHLYEKQFMKLKRHFAY